MIIYTCKAGDADCRFPEIVKETFLFIMPSTSGAAGTYPVRPQLVFRSALIHDGILQIQRSEKVQLLKDLRCLVKNQKEGKLDTTEMVTIPTEPV